MHLAGERHEDGQTAEVAQVEAEVAMAEAGPEEAVVDEECEEDAEVDGLGERGAQLGGEEVALFWPPC